MSVRTFKELLAWQRAMDLVTQIYVMTRRFPKEEMYGLTNQLRRAAVSVPSNLAEGQGCGIGAEFAHHVRIAYGSLQDIETQLMIAERLNYIDEEEFTKTAAIVDEVGRLTRGLLKSLRPILARNSQPATRNSSPA